jgi:hypothetical protein
VKSGVSRKKVPSIGAFAGNAGVGLMQWQPHLTEALDTSPFMLFLQDPYAAKDIQAVDLLDFPMALEFSCCQCPV